MTAVDVETIAARWHLAPGTGPEDVRQLVAEVTRLAGIVGRVRALLEDPYVDDHGVEMVLLQDVADAIAGAP